jgi:tRNA(Glu) U13 pseudouridine synthase TruD
MDKLVGKIDSLEAKIDKYRPKTPQEKLELRSIDSGPFNQKLTDFFVDKEEDMEKSGKNEYVLTTDQVKDFSTSDVKDSFRAFPGNERPVEVK